MVLFTIALASSVPTVEDLRVNGIGETWEKCITVNYALNEEFLNIADTESLVSNAEFACAAFEPEYLSAMIKYAPEVLKEEGITSFGASVPNSIAKEATGLFKQNMLGRATDQVNKLKAEK